MPTATYEVLTEPSAPPAILLSPQECEIILFLRTLVHGTLEVRVQDKRPVLVEVTQKHKLA